MPFWRKKKSEPEEHIWVRPVVTIDPKAEAQLGWRIQYDKERDEAVAAGRSCGKCIDGVICFSEVDSSPCNCKLATEKATNEASEQSAS